MDIYYFKDNSYEEARIGKKKESKLLDSLATTGFFSPSMETSVLACPQCIQLLFISTL